MLVESYAELSAFRLIYIRLPPVFKDIYAFSVSGNIREVLLYKSNTQGGKNKVQLCVASAPLCDTFE